MVGVEAAAPPHPEEKDQTANGEASERGRWLAAGLTLVVLRCPGTSLESYTTWARAKSWGAEAMVVAQV